MAAVQRGLEQQRERERLRIEDPATFVWSRRIAYFHCGFFRYMHHSGYLRLLEELVDRYLDHVGMNIGEMCRSRRWIPVVQDHVVEIESPAEMEEEIGSTLRVRRTIGRRLFVADVAWYVVRDGTVVRTARGHITHGYVEVGYPDWESRLVTLEPWMLERLQPDAPRQSSGGRRSTPAKVVAS